MMNETEKLSGKLVKIVNPTESGESCDPTGSVGRIRKIECGNFIEENGYSIEFISGPCVECQNLNSLCLFIRKEFELIKEHNRNKANKI